MSKKSWDNSWGKLVPLIQTKTETKKENQILDQKICYAISQVLTTGANIDDVSPTVQCTFLHLCVGKGLLKSSQLLIQKGANTHKTNLFHETPDKYISYAPFNKEKLARLFIFPTLLTQKKTR